MNDSKLSAYDLARRLVERELGICVSLLVSTALEVVGQDARVDEQFDLSDLQDAAIGYDYDAAIDNWLYDADFCDLESAAEEVGYWDDLIHGTDCLAAYDDAVERCAEIADMPVIEWLDSLDKGSDERKALHKAAVDWIRDRIDDQADFCLQLYIEAEYLEVYEWWVVTGWLQGRLEDRGEVTLNWMGLTLWGRCTTGQSVSLDGVIQRIAIDLWPDEFSGREMHYPGDSA